MPLLIYLHGAGGVGDQIGKIKGQAMKVWQGLQNLISGRVSSLHHNVEKDGWSKISTYSCKI